MTRTIGIADTMFARVDMAAEALAVIGQQKDEEYKVLRYTVPGMKDLPVAAKKLIEQGSEIVLAMGWVGGEDIDERCAHEANLGLLWVEVQAGVHVLKVFFHEQETPKEDRQARIALERARKHCENALLLLKGPTALTPFAGLGKRQGNEDAGGIALKR